VADWLGVEADPAGRVKVNPDCSVPGHPEVFVIGDAMTLTGEDGKPLPGVAQVAMQQGAFVAHLVSREAAWRARQQENPSGSTECPRPAFRYKDKGIMATIGRKMAVAQIGRVHLKGTLAWLAWLLIHIWYLIGFRNKLLVMINWAWSYVTFQRGARLITGIQPSDAATQSRAELRAEPPPAASRFADRPEGD
jgi:NADH dehydrogenase